jgi:hypothetical protein
MLVLDTEERGAHDDGGTRGTDGDRLGGHCAAAASSRAGVGASGGTTAK